MYRFFVLLFVYSVPMALSAAEPDPEAKAGAEISGLKRTGVPSSVLPVDPLTPEEVNAFVATCKDVVEKSILRFEYNHPWTMFFAKAKAFNHFNIMDFIARREGENPITLQVVADAVKTMEQLSRFITLENGCGVDCYPEVRKALDPYLGTLSKMTGVLAYYVTEIFPHEHCFASHGSIPLGMSARYGDTNPEAFFYVRTAFGYLPFTSRWKPGDGESHYASSEYAIQGDSLFLSPIKYDSSLSIIAAFHDDAGVMTGESGFHCAASYSRVARSGDWAMIGKFHLKFSSGAFGARPFELAPEQRCDPKKVLGSSSAMSLEGFGLPFAFPNTIADTPMLQAVQDWSLAVVQEDKVFMDALRRGEGSAVSRASFLPIPTTVSQMRGFLKHLEDGVAAGDPEVVALVEVMGEGPLSIQDAQEEIKELQKEVEEWGLLENDPVPLVEDREPVVLERASSVSPHASGEERRTPAVSSKKQVGKKRKPQGARRKGKSTGAGAGGGSSAGVCAASKLEGVGAPLPSGASEKLARVKRWGQAVSFLKWLGLKKTSGKTAGSHAVFSGESGEKVRVAKPHTDKAEKRFAARFKETIFSLFRKSS